MFDLAPDKWVVFLNFIFLQPVIKVSFAVPVVSVFQSLAGAMDFRIAKIGLMKLAVVCIKSLLFCID